MFLKSLLALGITAASLTSSYAADKPKDNKNKEHYLVLAIGLKNIDQGMQKQDVQYQCEPAKNKKISILPTSKFKVRYINIGDNSLAILPISTGDQVMTNVISASGAKYTANSYTWWSKGEEAFFSDEMNEKAELHCKEIK